MDMLGLVFKAVRGTVEAQVQRALDAFGQGEASQEPAVQPPEPVPAAEKPSEPPVPSFEVVDAVFPAGRPEEPVPGAAPAAAPPAQPAEARSQPAPPVATAEPAEPTAEEAAEDAARAQAVLKLLAERGAPMRGVDIAEETRITPWWRLKDLLHRLTREGRVVQTDEGLYGLRADPDPGA